MSQDLEQSMRERRVTVILQEHARPLERLLASYCRSRADQADLRQEIAVALWRSLDGFRGECSERTFLLRIAHNRALSFLAKKGFRTEDIDLHGDTVAGTSGKNPQIAYERREGQQRLLWGVQALPLPQRQVVLLLLEGSSHAEIAAILGTTENNVGVRAARARAALRILLEGDEP